MVRVIYKTIFAMLAAMALSPTEANLGVAYSPWQPDKVVTKENLITEVTGLAFNFSVFRSYLVVANGINLIEIAAIVGVRIDVGVDMTDETKIDGEIEAVCSAYNSHKDTIRTVYIGNENLKNGKYGKYSSETIISYINKVKDCTNNNVDVGTVQRINEWLSAPGIEDIVKASTANGVNIHPFFADSSTLSPFEMLKAQWGQIETKYGSTKTFAVTETGWPSMGGTYNGKIASVSIAQEYLDNVATWSVDKNVIWFMLCDSLISYTGQDIEKYFGLYDSTCTTLKLKLPGSLKDSSSHNPSPPVPSMDQPVQQNVDNQGTPVPSGNQPVQQSADYQPTPVTSGDQSVQQNHPVTLGDQSGQQNPQMTLVDVPLTQTPVTSSGQLLEMDPPVNSPGTPVVTTGKDCTI